MTERKNIPTLIPTQSVTVLSKQRGSLVARGLRAVQNSKQPALTKINGAISAEEQYRLGLMYDHAVGIPQDDKEAVKWYRLAADQGHYDAQRNLEVMYHSDRDVSQDAALALKFWACTKAYAENPDMFRAADEAMRELDALMVKKLAYQQR